MGERICRFCDFRARFPLAIVAAVDVTRLVSSTFKTHTMLQSKLSKQLNMSSYITKRSMQDNKLQWIAFT